MEQRPLWKRQVGDIVARATPARRGGSPSGEAGGRLIRDAARLAYRIAATLLALLVVAPILGFAAVVLSVGIAGHGLLVVVSAGLSLALLLPLAVVLLARIWYSEDGASRPG